MNTSKLNITYFSIILILPASLTFNIDEVALGIESVDKLINDGTVLLEKQKAEQALENFDKALEMEPENTGALNFKGMALAGLGRFEDAIAEFDKVIEINPNYPYIYHNKALALQSLGRYEEATDAFNKDTESIGKESIATNKTSNSTSPTNHTSSLLQYENSTYDLKIQYPSDWTVESGNNSPDDEIFSIVLLSPPISQDANANTFLDIGYDSSVQANDSNLDEYVRGVIETLKTDTSRSDFRVDSVKTDTMIANRSAYTLVSTDTVDGIPMKYLEVGTFVEDKLYYMLFSTEESKYNSFLPVVQKMIDSFELVSNQGPSLNKNEKTTEVDTTESEGLSSVDNSNSSFLSYENSKNGIKLQYPSSWTLQDDQSGSEDGMFKVNINAPITSNGLSYVVIGYNPSLEGENTSLEKYVDDTVKGTKKEDIFDVESVKTDSMLSGRQAYSLVLTNTADGTDRKSIEVGTLVGNKLYYMLFDAEKQDYNTLLPDVQKMIDSFEIIGNEADEKQNISSVISPSFSNNKNVTSEQIVNTNESLTVGSSESTSQKFTTMMSGDEEVPQVDTDASGVATFIPLEGVVKYDVNVTGISKATEAHIHLGDKGENGYMVVDLLEGGEHEQTENGMTIKGNITDSSLVGPLQGMTTAELIHLMNGGGIPFMAGGEAGEFKHLYVNVHTENHPDGEIRGQIS